MATQKIPNKLEPSQQAIYWLLISLSITFTLYAFNLNNWVPASFAVFAIWRYLIEKNNWPYPRLWLRLPLTIAGGVAVLASYGSLFGRDASVALLAVMIAMKLLETRTKRDFIVMVILSYFLTVNILLFTQAIWVCLAILLALFSLTACLISASYQNAGNQNASNQKASYQNASYQNISLQNKQALNHTQAWKVQAKLAGKLLLQALPIMLVLFVLFPRIPGPIWGIPQDAYSGMTGLSDSMEPGNINQLSLSSKVAFRAEFKSTIPANHQLYWRGPVLWHQEGRRWTMTSNNINLPTETLETAGVATDYTITLEPHNRNWLLMLDLPKVPSTDSLPDEAAIKHDMQVLSKLPIRTRIRYEGHSFLQYTLGATLSDYERTLALQLIDDENPKTRQLATKWVNEQKSPVDIIQAALSMFRNQPFVYTLSPPLLGSEPVDDFLFNTKRGFCEHYASSFVYLMRAAGVPARIVTGYQGGEINPSGNYLIVRQSDAHAWAEVWLQDKGWTRVDPTSAVSPSRIESGIAAALLDSDLLPLLSRQDYPMLKKLTLNWDAVNNGWNQWVLGYDQNTQLALLKKILHKDIAWEDIGLILVSTMIALMLLVSYFLLRNNAAALDPVKKAYQQFLKKLSKAGVNKLAHEGAVGFGERAAKALPNQSIEIQEISALYSSIQYAKHEIINANKTAAHCKIAAHNNHKLNLLKQLVKKLKLK
jgi:transglutaminase-like putative cysteine protease